MHRKTSTHTDTSGEHSYDEISRHNQSGPSFKGNYESESHQLREKVSHDNFMVIAIVADSSVFICSRIIIIFYEQTFVKIMGKELTKLFSSSSTSIKRQKPTCCILSSKFLQILPRTIPLKKPRREG